MPAKGDRGVLQKLSGATIVTIEICIFIIILIIAWATSRRARSEDQINAFKSKIGDLEKEVHTYQVTNQLPQLIWDGLKRLQRLEEDEDSVNKGTST